MWCPLSSLCSDIAVNAGVRVLNLWDIHGVALDFCCDLCVMMVHGTVFSFSCNFCIEMKL